MKPFNLCYRKLVLYSVIAHFFMGCNEFVEVGIPQSELVRETVFSDGATAKAALMDIYGQMRDITVFNGNLFGFSSLLGHYSDELILFNSTSIVEPYYQHTIVPGNFILSTIWNNCYNLVYASNGILEGLEKSTHIEKEVSDQLKGEALFVRACVHFYLVNLFGDVPYITTTDYNVSSKVSRMDTGEVYDLMIADLEQAKKLLSEEYISDERVRPNRYTASALLSRVFLYAELWTLAEAEASEVLEQAMYGLTPLQEVFLKNSQEAIWQFKPSSSTGNTIEAQTFIFTTSPPHTTALSETLVQSFDPGDQRLSSWVGSIEDGDNTWYYAHKYKLNTASEEIGSEEYTVVFRLAEQYLIRAEARAQIGLDMIGAVADIDEIRQRAGLPLISETNPGIGQAQLLDAIFHERRVELFTEWGHRWFDLKRTGRASSILQGLKPGWKDTDILLPIPESELLLNPNLNPQNPGYN